MRPRQFVFGVLGAIVGAILGYLAAAALHLSLMGGAAVLGVVGVAVGIGVGRYLGRAARLRGAGKALPVIDTDTERSNRAGS